MGNMVVLICRAVLGMTCRREHLLQWVKWVLVEDLYDRW